MKILSRTTAAILSGVLFAGSLTAGMLITNDTQAQGKSNATRGDFAKLKESDAYKVRDQGQISGSPLTVRIKIEADNERDNAQRSKDFETEFDVVVLRDGRPVRDAQVTVQAYKGPTVRLRLDDDDDDDDDTSYEGEIKGYHRAYQISVIAGEDRIENIRFAGPAIHTFTSPKHRQRVPANRDLNITWKAEDRADKTWLSGDEFDRISIEDTGRYTLAAAKLDDDDDDLELKRANIMQLTNAGPDSQVRISVKNEIDIRTDDND